jgi:hypothetical protein
MDRSYCDDRDALDRWVMSVPQLTTQLNCSTMTFDAAIGCLSSSTSRIEGALPASILGARVDV